MDKKLFAVVAVVIVVAAACVVVFATGSNDDDGPVLTGSGRLLVYGNADNNDYLDENDVKTIQNILEEGSWDKEKYPFADANHDGVVTSEDVD